MIDITNDQKLRQIIMDHYVSSANKGFIKDSRSVYLDLRSESCSDKLTLEVVLENDTFVGLKFEGGACAIATASTDILITMALGKTKAEFAKILIAYEFMINYGQTTDIEVLEELVAFKNIFRQKNRKSCAMLGAKGFKTLLKS